MNKRIIGLGIIVFCVLVIGLIGCSTTTSTSTTTTTTVITTTTTTVPGGQQYFPHTDGNAWNYQRTSSNTTETRTARVSFTGTAVVNSVKANSVTAQLLRTEYLNSSGAPTSTSETLVSVTSAGVFSYGNSTDPTTEASTMYAFPLTIGSTWSGIYATFEVLAIENVTVPAGTYSNCFKVRQYNSSTSYSDTWLAENVGIVKALGVNSTSTTTTELTSVNF